VPEELFLSASLHEYEMSKPWAETIGIVRPFLSRAQFGCHLINSIAVLDIIFFNCLYKEVIGCDRHGKGSCNGKR